MKKKKGFTLIELLVVVAIIGLLATLSIVALNTARAKARDTKRVGDIKNIQTALELYYSNAGAYPASLNDLKPNYMGQIPTAPTPHDGTCSSSTNAYVYVSTSSDAYRSYTLSYCLGADTGGLASGTAVATPAGLK